MNPDSPLPPREELEAQLTALILGELPAEQAFVLGQAIEKDAELARLYERLKHTVKLVREITADSAEQIPTQTMPLKMSNERREKLLQQFKTVKPSEFAEPRHSSRSWLVPLTTAAVILLLAAISIPNFVKSRTTSQSNSVINNLRQLDGAKQQWALENHKSESDVATMNDLKPYLKGAGPPPVMGETYVVGRVGEPVSAELDTDRAKKSFGRWTGSGFTGGEKYAKLQFSPDGQVTVVDRSSTAIPTTITLGAASENSKPREYSGNLHVITGSATPEAESNLRDSLGNTRTELSGAGAVMLPSELANSSPNPELTIAPKLNPPKATIVLPSFEGTVGGGSGGGGGGGGGIRQTPDQNRQSGFSAGDPRWIGMLEDKNQGFQAGAPGLVTQTDVNRSQAAEGDAFRRRYGLVPAKSSATEEQSQKLAESQAIRDGGVGPSTGLPVAVDSAMFKGLHGGATWAAATPQAPTLSPRPVLAQATDREEVLSSARDKDGNQVPVLGDMASTGRLYTSKRGDSEIQNKGQLGFELSKAKPVTNYQVPSGTIYTGAKSPENLSRNSSSPGFGGIASGREPQKDVAADKPGIVGKNLKVELPQQYAAAVPTDSASLAVAEPPPVANPGTISAGGIAGGTGAEKNLTLAYDDLNRNGRDVGLTDGRQVRSNGFSLGIVGYSNFTNANAVVSADQAHAYDRYAYYRQLSEGASSNSPLISEFRGYNDPGGSIPQASLSGIGSAVPLRAQLPEAHFQVREIVTNSSGGTSIVERGPKTSELIQDAKQLYESGKLNDAEVRLRAAVKESPQNQDAYYYLNLVKEARFKDAAGKQVASLQDLQQIENLPSLSAAEHKKGSSSVSNSTILETKRESEELGRAQANKPESSASPAATISSDDEMIPAGTVNFQAVDLDDVLKIYGELANRTILRPPNLPAAKVFLKLQTPVTKREAIQALDAVLGMNGIAMVNMGDKFVKAVATPNASQAGHAISQPDEAKKVVPKSPPAEPQPEISTLENSFSTFSLNVSDVSFKLAAASLEKGAMPDPAGIRSEEFINAFDYRDPEPPAGVPVAFAWERARYPFAQNRDLLRFSIKTAAQGRQAGRPLNIVLLLDNSGSMERADRVQIIREALRVLASQLQPQDKFSVVTFARTARLWVDGVPGDQAGKAAEEVSGLTPEGGTNLEEAMNVAYQTALRHYLPNGINRVVLLTDGAANLGNVDPESLKQKVEAQRKQGFALDCFGIGWEGYNDDLLEILSRNGDGRYGFINSPEEAATEFAGQLAGALQVAASDVKVQVEFNPNRVTAYRQIGYAKHQLTKEQFRDNTVDAAEIGAAESGNALYVIEANPAGEGPLAIVRVRFKVPGTSDYREHEWTVPYTGNAVSLGQATPPMRLAATASAFSEWLMASPYTQEVTPDNLLGYLGGAPEVYGADARPKKLEWMIRQAKSITGK